MSTPKPRSHRLPSLAWSALHHGAEIWRALRRGDQTILISTLLRLARSTEHPDAFYVDARPVGPRILVVYSAAGLRAMADCAELDKGPSSNIAIAISGELDAYEAIMGPAQGRPYAARLALIDTIIKRAQRGLKRLVEPRAAEHLAGPGSFDLRRAQYFTASVILDQLFPARQWTRTAITETIDTFETNAKWIGPAVQNSTLRGEDDESMLRLPGMQQTIERYDRLFRELADEERAWLEAADDAAQDEPRVGLPTELDRAGLSWADRKALMTTFFAASYETVSTALTEWVYQVTRTPSLWRAMQDADGDERRQRIRASLYEAVRIVTPLPILMRGTERRLTLRVHDGDDPPRALVIEPDQLVIGLIAAPLWDPAMFPDPGTMRLHLRDEQREHARFAWGLQATRSSGAPDRFCQGFSYSIALMTATIDFLLERCDSPRMVTDCPIQMFGTRSRRDFVAQLVPKT